MLMTIVGAVTVMATTLLTIVIPNELRGLCVAISAMANALLGVALAPVIVSQLSSAMGGPTIIGTFGPCRRDGLRTWRSDLALGRPYFPGKAVQ